MARGITEDELALLGHWSMWGSEGYPIEKHGRSWHWRDWRSVKGSPQVYRTKLEAVAAFEQFIDILLAAKAGRL